MATLEGLDLSTDTQATALEETNSEQMTGTQQSTLPVSELGISVNKLGLSPQDRDSLLRAIAFNANTYRTAFRQTNGVVLYQRLDAERFTHRVITQNADFIRQNAIFPEFNFLVAPSLATADSKAMLLLSNGLYVRGVFGRANVEDELDAMNPSYYIELKDEDGNIVFERCGLSAIVAANTRFDYEKVPVLEQKIYQETAVELIYDTNENAKRNKLSGKERKHRDKLQASKADRNKKRRLVKASRRANR